MWIYVFNVRNASVILTFKPYFYFTFDDHYKWFLVS